MMITIKMPGRVWDDFLDPAATGMQAELELSPPRIVRRGRGFTAVFENVHDEIARELADYLRSRGDMLLGNSDPEFDGRERGIYRAAIRLADEIDEQLR